MSKYADLVTKLKAADKETIGLIAELLTILAEPDDVNNNNPKKSVKETPAISEDMSSKERAALILEGVGAATPKDWKISSGTTGVTQTITTTGAKPYITAATTAGTPYSYGDSSTGLTMTSHASLLL